MFNFYSDVPTLCFINTHNAIVILITIKTIHLIQSRSQYASLYAFLSITLLVNLACYGKTQLYLVFFLILTELTSLYLILVITLGNSYTRVIKKPPVWLAPASIVMLNPLVSQTYIYFSFYNVYFTGAFNQFLYILKSDYFIWILNTIVVLTWLIIIILIPFKSGNRQNLVGMLTAITGFINQIPLNLNLFSNPSIMKWM